MLRPAVFIPLIAAPLAAELATTRSGPSAQRMQGNTVDVDLLPVTIFFLILAVLILRQKHLSRLHLMRSQVVRVDRVRPEGRAM